MAGHEPYSVIPIRLQTSNGEVAFECLTHRQDGQLIVELEAQAGAYSIQPLNADEHIRKPGARIEWRELEMVAQQAAQEIFTLSGFERVMVYRFDEYWNGEVLAEVVAERTDSYMGQRFPASDIPAQARQLLQTKVLRVIVDADAIAAPILPEIGPLTGKPLNLTQSVLRDASSIHLEYLRNMGVRSSMTISILVRQKLWGMIACHSTKPRHLDHSTREVCGWIGQMLATQILLRTDDADFQSRLISRRLLERYMATAETAMPLALVISFHANELMNLFQADGLIARVEGRVSSHGLTVDERALLPSIRALRQRLAGGVACSHELRNLDQAATAYAPKASGALFIGLSGVAQEEGGDYLLLLRRELVETVTWQAIHTKA